MNEYKSYTDDDKTWIIPNPNDNGAEPDRQFGNGHT